MVCDYCDEVFDVDDWIADGEPSCDTCGKDFCSEHCQQMHYEVVLEEGMH